ncbi:MAG: NAD kinase [Candidatus Kapaibacteriales bacterium]
MKTIAIYENKDKPNALHYAREASKMLFQLGAKLIADNEFVQRLDEVERERFEIYPTNDFGKIADVAISFGGDGTILTLGKLLLESDVPIMGVNVGRLGFLAEFRVEDLEKGMKELVTGNYRLTDRSLLTATCNGKKGYALNDIVIERQLSSRMITIEAYANNSHIADYKADGLIVATPTGSTAYNLSSGGPIIAPECQVFCLTPIAPHSLSLRPLVVPDSSEIRLVPHSRDGSTHLVMDGQEQLTVEDGQTIFIRKSQNSIKLINTQSGSYFSSLKEKLSWAASSPVGAGGD